MTDYRSSVVNGQTQGISPKTVLAFFFPFIATLATVVTTWVVDGTFDMTQVRIGVGGLIASGIAALGAYVGRTGAVTNRL